MIHNESSFIQFHPQPDFPTEDISEHNAAMATYYLHHATERDAYLETYQENLQLLHDVGNSALIGADIKLNNNKAEYQAFCHGFTAIDYVATLLDSRSQLQIASGEGMQRFYLDPGEMADFELWQRRSTWMQTHQATLEMIRSVSDSHSETLNQFAARAIGAQMSSEILHSR